MIHLGKVLLTLNVLSRIGNIENEVRLFLSEVKSKQLKLTIVVDLLTADF